MIDSQPGIPSVGVAEKVPKGINLPAGMNRAHCIHPAVLEQVGECLANLYSEQSIIYPAFGLIHVGFDRNHVVVACEHDRRSGEMQLSGMSEESVEPTQLVFEFRAGCRIAVGQIKGSDHDTGDGGLDVSAMHVITVPGKN